MEALEYEVLVRSAFSYVNKEVVNRYGDPACLANTDIYSMDNIARVKSASSYAIEIFLTGVDSNNTTYVEDIIDAVSLQEISTIIEDFKKNFMFKNYKITDSGYFVKI